MKETDRQRTEHHLEEFAAWRASGLPLHTYAEQRGESLSLWRGRLTWERRWQQMLAGTYQKPSTPAAEPTAFVKAVAQSNRLTSQTRPVGLIQALPLATSGNLGTQVNTMA